MTSTAAKQTHINPVYGSYFADPFIWRHQETYYAIGTGAAEAGGQTVGKVFPILQSADFYQWRFASSALIRPEPALGSHFWAPAVAQAEGKFFLYYSVGQGSQEHQFRVAVSDSPQGPYRDLGPALVDPQACPFAIDPHPFQDDNGEWYLFYARDFLDVSPNARAGTGLAVRRMKSMTELAPKNALVLRARSDWQRFRTRGRCMAGPGTGTRSKDRSCANTTGVTTASTAAADGKQRIMAWTTALPKACSAPIPTPATNPVRASCKPCPTTCSVPAITSWSAALTAKPNHLVYHAWDKEMKVRQMFIDRLTWTPDGPHCDGPTWGAAFEAKIAA